ncbi:MAG: hypothetical protein RLZZ450_6484 [Pseudomonadota bacterium]
MDDLLRELGSDPGQQLELRGAREVGVDGLPIAQRVALSRRRRGDRAASGLCVRGVGRGSVAHETSLAHACEHHCAHQRQQTHQREASGQSGVHAPCIGPLRARLRPRGVARDLVWLRRRWRGLAAPRVLFWLDWLGRLGRLGRLTYLGL